MTIQGKKITYSVTLHGINVRRMPPLDDALAEKIEPGSTLESLKQKIRERQQESSDYQFDNAKRNAAVKKLLSLFTCELPEETVAAETGTILKDIVAESQARGFSDDDIKSNTEQIVANATEGARERVRESPARHQRRAVDRRAHERLVADHHHAAASLELLRQPRLEARPTREQPPTAEGDPSQHEHHEQPTHALRIADSGRGGLRLHHRLSWACS